MGTLEFKPIQLAVFCKPVLYYIYCFFSNEITTKIRKFGGGKRDRTADLLHAMQALSQLSYTPVYYKIWVLKLATIREGAILMTSEPIVNEYLAYPRVLLCDSNCVKSITACGFQPALRCSATTLVNMPPRTKNLAVTRIKRGCVAFTKSSKIRLVTAS
jgi:hypothetical protein